MVITKFKPADISLRVAQIQVPNLSQFKMSGMSPVYTTKYPTPPPQKNRPSSRLFLGQCQ